MDRLDEGTARTAARAVARFLGTCYPGWADADIAAEPRGSEFLRAREAIRAAELGGGDVAAALAQAAAVVRDSFPSAGMADAELDESMGIEDATQLRAARDTLLAAFGVGSLHDIAEPGAAPRR